MAVIKAKLETEVGNPNPYNVSNPHPGLGVDPNIINEFGHTHYPKWIDHPTEKETVQIKQNVGRDQVIVHNVQNVHPKRVLVQNEKEEKALMALGVKTAPENKSAKWDK